MREGFVEAGFLVIVAGVVLAGVLPWEPRNNGTTGSVDFSSRIDAKPLSRNGLAERPSSTAEIQPSDAPFYRSLDLAPVPANCHVMLPPAMGVVLGCWAADYPRDLDESTAAYWLVGTGERVDLAGTVDIGGVAYTPRWPQPGVDAATGATLWNANNSAGEWTQVVVVLPGVARSADFDGDGVVNTMDFTAFLNAWADQREAE